MARLVAIDTMTLVWGVRKTGTAKEKKRAKWLFESLQAEGAQIIVPTVVVAEYLTPTDVGKHIDIIRELNKGFFLTPFDVRCASMAADLFSKRQNEQDRQPGWKKRLRADTLIIATARVHGALVMYSGDRNLRNLASEVMRSEDLPTQGPNLFDQ